MPVARVWYPNSYPLSHVWYHKMQNPMPVTNRTPYYFFFLHPICWYLDEAWQDVRFVACDLLASARGMTRCTICCLWFASFCGRHGKIHDLLSAISSFCVRHGKIHDLVSVICWQGERLSHTEQAISKSLQSPKPYTLNPKTLNRQDRR